MNKLSKLTFRYMRKNIKREVTTLIAIVFTTILIYSVLAIGIAMYRGSAKDFYERSFSYDAVYMTDLETANKIESDTEIGINNCFYFAVDEKIGIDVAAVNDFSKIPGNIVSKGTVPKNANEIAISYYEYVGGTESKIIGSTYNGVRMINGKAERCDLQISGCLKELYGNNDLDEYFVGRALTVLKEEQCKDSTIYVCVQFSEKKDFASKSAAIAEKYGVTEYRVSDAALQFFTPKEYGDGSDYSISQLIYLLISTLVAYIALFIIRNAFNISLQERCRDYGLLRLIGMTKKQIVSIIVSEALILAGIGLLIGLPFGYLITFIGKKILENVSKGAITMYLTLEIGNIIKTILIILATALVAMINPIEALYKTIPIDAVKGNVFGKKNKKNIAKKEKKQSKKNTQRKNKKKSLLVRVFGFEMDYAIKSNARNKRRMVTTVLTLAIISSLIVTITTAYRFTEKTMSDFALLARYGGIVGVNDTSYDNVMKVKEEMLDTGYVDKLEVLYSSMCFRYDSDEGRLKELIYITGMESDSYNDLIETLNVKLEESKYYDVIYPNIANDNKYKVGDILTAPTANGDVKIHVAAVLDSKEANEYFKSKLAEFEYCYFISEYKKGNILRLSSDNENERCENSASIYMHISDYKYFENMRKLAADNNSRYTYYDLGDELGVNEMLRVMKVIRIIMIYISVLIFMMVIANIINIKAADITLRKDEFNIMRTIGLSEKRRKRILYMENAVLSAFAGVIGIVMGTLLGNVAPKAFFGILDMGTSFTIDIFTSVLMLVVLIVTSTLVVWVSDNE